MDDLISRQAAIDAISYSEIAYYPGDYDSEVLRRDSVVKAAILSIVPIDAEPERKTGRWKMEPDPYGFFDEIPVCSECGCTTKMRETYKFCPNCGADMRGGEK